MRWTELRVILGLVYAEQQTQFGYCGNMSEAKILSIHSSKKFIVLLNSNMHFFINRDGHDKIEPNIGLQ